jgi:hypothetical protein
MTDGGLGVAFFAPFDNHRYFLSWLLFEFLPLVSEDSSLVAVMPFCKVNSSGFGSLQEC